MYCVFSFPKLHNLWIWSMVNLFSWGILRKMKFVVGIVVAVDWDIERRLLCAWAVLSIGSPANEQIGQQWFYIYTYIYTFMYFLCKFVIVDGKGKSLNCWLLFLLLSHSSVSNTNIFLLSSYFFLLFILLCCVFLIFLDKFHCLRCWLQEPERESILASYFLGIGESKLRKQLK